jgi:prolyl-tRNA synthetase
MRGVPLRLEIGPRDLDRKVVTLATRLGEKSEIPRDSVVSSVMGILSDITRALSDRAATEIRGRVTAAGTLDQASTAVETGVAVISWCQQRECADILEEKTGGSILGTDIGGNRLPEIPRPCIICGKEGTPTLLARTF